MCRHREDHGTAAHVFTPGRKLRRANKQKSSQTHRGVFKTSALPARHGKEGKQNCLSGDKNGGPALSGATGRVPAACACGNAATVCAGPDAQDHRQLLQGLHGQAGRGLGFWRDNVRQQAKRERGCTILHSIRYAPTPSTTTNYPPTPPLTHALTHTYTRSCMSNCMDRYMDTLQVVNQALVSRQGKHR